MRRLARLALACLCMGSVPSFGQFSYVEKPPLPVPFEIVVEGLATGKSDITTNVPAGQELAFAWGRAKAGFKMPVDENWGIMSSLGYSHTRIDWKDNPLFNKENFGYANLELTAYFCHAENWVWLLATGVQMDTDHFNFQDYSLYNGMIWGTYTLNSYWKIHAGFLGRGGMKKNEVFPIIGFQFLPDYPIRINAVYPIDMSAYYDFADCWSVSVAARIFRSLHRTDANEVESRAVFEYRTWGAELGLNWHPFPGTRAGIFAGSNVGGTVQISNENGGDERFFEFDPSGYAGARFDLDF